MDAGILDAVEDELAKPQHRRAKIAWDHTKEINRDDPLISSIGTILGLSEAEIDDLFEAAKQL